MSTIHTDVADLPPLATYKQAAAWAGTTDRHLYKMIRDGRFPKPIFIGDRCPRFRRSDLLNWLDVQSAGNAAK